MIFYSLRMILRLIWEGLLIILRKIIFRHCFSNLLNLIVSFLLLLVIIYCLIISWLRFITKRLGLIFLLLLVIRLWRWPKIILKFMILSFIKIIILFWFSNWYCTDLLAIMAYVFNIWFFLNKILLFLKLICLWIETEISLHHFHPFNSIANILDFLYFMFICILLKLWCWSARKLLFYRFINRGLFLFTFWLFYRLLEKIIFQSFISKRRLLYLWLLFWSRWNMRTWWFHCSFLRWFNLSIMNFSLRFFRLIRNFWSSFILKRGKTVIRWIGIFPSLRFRLVKYFSGWTVPD